MPLIRRASRPRRPRTCRPRSAPPSSTSGSGPASRMPSCALDRGPRRSARSAGQRPDRRARPPRRALGRLSRPRRWQGVGDPRRGPDHERHGGRRAASGRRRGPSRSRATHRVHGRSTARARNVGAPQTIDQVGLYGGSVRWQVDPGVAEPRVGAHVAVGGQSIGVSPRRVMALVAVPARSTSTSRSVSRSSERRPSCRRCILAPVAVRARRGRCSALRRGHRCGSALRAAARPTGSHRRR